VARRGNPVILRYKGAPDAPLLDEALSALNGGGVAALPTDTVYGLVARADSGHAVKRIFRLKGRDFRKPLVLLAVDGPEALRLANEPPECAKDLAKKHWPGPLTLVLRASSRVEGWGLGRDGTVGIRVSPEPVVRMILERMDVPLASTSANRSGRPECHSGAEVLESLDGPPDMLLDGGERPRRKPSTVLDLSGPRPVLLRRGVIGREDIEAACGRPAALSEVSVLFVCTGNTCRSPMAEGLLRKALPKQLRAKVRVGSCGTGALPGVPATGTAQKAARKRGFDISGHRSRPLTLDLLDEADLVVAMEQRHLESVMAMDPKARAVMMDPDGVPDPIGGGLDDYLGTIDLLESHLPGLMEKVAGLLDGG